MKIQEKPPVHRKNSAILIQKHEECQKGQIICYQRINSNGKNKCATNFRKNFLKIYINPGNNKEKKLYFSRK